MLTVSVILVAMGVLALLDLNGWTIPAAVYVVTALGIVSTGLIVGAWLGRSRGLIVLGIVLGLALGPATVADVVTDGDWGRWDNAEQLRLRPAFPQELEPVYDFGAGQIELDLTQLEGTDDLVTRIEAGAGEVLVVIPPTMDLTVDAHTGVGDLVLLDRRSSGFDSGRSLTDLGVDGPGGGDLVLEIDLGIGRVEVERAAA